MPEPTAEDLARGSAFNGNTQAVIDAARELREVRPEVVKPSADELVVVRQADGRVEPLYIDAYLKRPRRQEGTHAPADVQSLIDLVNALDPDDDGATTVWVHPTSGHVQVVFDDHAGGEAGHGEHRAALQLQQSPEWKRWAKLDRQWLQQADFAEHIEDSIPDIADPSGAELLEIASTLTGKTEVNWTAGMRLQDGTVKLRFDEEATAKAGQKGELEIPHHFTLMLAPFYGEERVPITARLRYRVPSGDLRIGYVLDRPEEVVQATLLRVRERLASEFGRVYVGSPR